MLNEFLKRLRESRGLTLDDVGKKLGVQRFAVHKWETGAVRIYADHLARYLDAVSATPEEREQALRLAAEWGGGAPHLAAEEAPAGPAP